MEKHVRIILVGTCFGILVLYIVLDRTVSFEQLKVESISNTSLNVSLTNGLIPNKSMTFQRTELLIPNTSMEFQRTKAPILNADSKFKSPYMGGLQRYNASVRRNPPGRHEILWWNEAGWMKPEHWTNYCNLSLCEYPNCVLSWDRSHIKQSSAVLFSLGVAVKKALKYRTNKDQPWVFFTMEAPRKVILSYFTDEAYSGVFNWSMTYIRDSDIFMPYYKIGYRSNPPDRDYSAIFRRKTKQVAWLVGNCHAEGKRHLYVQQLQKYLKVDIYGTCTQRLVLKRDVNRLLAQYKFYLGFENTFCRDYVTEKYFEYMQHDAIVVVRGLLDYNSLLPNHTFINTADFGSIEQLGKYLNKLSNDETEYIRYLREKDKYFLYERRLNYCDSLCTICEKVNNLPENRRTYDSVIDWMGKCNPAQDLH